MAEYLELVGVKVEEKRVSWPVDNFVDVIRYRRLINAQAILFEAGCSIGRPSKWRMKMSLKTGDQDQDGRIGVELVAVEEPKCSKEEMVVEWSLKVDNGIGTGTAFVEKKTGSEDEKEDHAEEGGGTGWKFEIPALLDRAVVPPLVEGRLQIHSMLRLLAVSSSSSKSTTVRRAKMPSRTLSGLERWEGEVPRFVVGNDGVLRTPRRRVHPAIRMGF